MPDLAQSGVTIPSDSEPYHTDDHDRGEGFSATSSLTSSSPPVVLHPSPRTLWSFLRSAAINLFLPFVNGMMLGFGELFAHEAAFRLGWSNTRVRVECAVQCACCTELEKAMTDSGGNIQIFPLSRRKVVHPAGPGLEVREPRRGISDLNDLLALD